MPQAKEVTKDTTNCVNVAGVCHAKLSSICANSTTKCIDHVRGCKTLTIPLLHLPYRATLSKDSLSMMMKVTQVVTVLEIDLYHNPTTITRRL